MKKSIKILAVVMVAIMLCLTLASCGKRLSGTYKTLGQEITFDGKNVTIEYLGLVTLKGTYEIEDDKISFDFTGADEEDQEKYKDFLDTFTSKVDFEEGDDYIKIGNVKYTKAD